MMHVLLIHNRYRQSGGEDHVFASEAALLGGHGHRVTTHETSNTQWDDWAWGRRLDFVMNRMTNNAHSAQELRQLVAEARPDVAHVHNTFMMLSPSIFAVLREAGVPVVLTLHNYRIFCAAGTFSRNGRVCELCAGGQTWHAVAHRCWRGSAALSWLVHRQMQFHRRAGTWPQAADRYICLSDFSRRKFIANGFPPERLVVKPNFVPDVPSAVRMGDRGRSFALFAGRLVEEKGVKTLLEAFATLPDILLQIAGDGPLAGWLRQQIRERQLSHIDVLGPLENNAVRHRMAQAAFLVFPSQWYECFPLTLLEAGAAGLPVIASRCGALPEIVQDDETGLLFEPGNAAALASAVRGLWSDNAGRARMGAAARRRYERDFTPETNYGMLESIYREAMEASREPQKARFS